MNDYFLYEQLCALDYIASQYSEGRRLSPYIRRTAEEIASQTYRVAVIGEFKKGKSSLINALIGADILPTDILPATAVVTRVVYGTERRIVIHFRDGRSEERTLEELAAFATKLEKKNEEIALSIREICVSYPSVFCKNHIELLDTPGLNDTESMSEATLSVIGDVDAAIVVISAREPVSLTEQNLILDLIEQSGIRHIVFVVTFLDMLKREKDKDKMLAFIRQRLSAEVLELARGRFKDGTECMDKACRILEAPDLFGVSSLQAMEGFTNDDELLLESSRFPKFKEELFALLTAAQTADLPPKTMDVADLVCRDLQRWEDAEEASLRAQERQMLELLEARKAYLADSQRRLTGLLQEMDAGLSGQWPLAQPGLPGKPCADPLLKIFIKQLCSIHTVNNTHAHIKAALDAAAEEAAELMKVTGRELESGIQEAMGTAAAQFQAMRSLAGFSKEPFAQRLEAWQSRVSFPEFAWLENPVPDMDDLKGVNVIPTVRAALMQSVAAYAEKINQYIGSWRVVLIGQNRDDRQAGNSEEEKERALKEIKMKLNMLQFRYAEHRQQAEEIRKSLQSEAMGFSDGDTGGTLMMRSIITGNAFRRHALERSEGAIPGKEENR